MTRIQRTALVCSLLALVICSGWVNAAPIHDAAREGDVEKVKALLAADPKLTDARTEDGNTPLHLAALEGHAAVAQVLLEHGAQVNARGLRQETPLHMAMYYGHREVAELLLAHHAEIDAQNATGETPMHLAARKGQRNVVQLLMDHESDVDLRDKSGKSPAAVAAENGHSDLAEMLTPKVAELSEIQRLTFEGAKTFTAEALRNGLRTTPDFLEISDPFAPRHYFVEALKRKLQLGYEHQGFPQARIAARIQKQPARIVFTVDEGPRYRCSGVKISGLTNMPARPIVEWLTLTNAPARALQATIEFNDIAPSSRTINHLWSNPPFRDEPFWGKGGSAHFSAYDLQLVKDQVGEKLRDHGFLFSRIEVAVLPDSASRTAELRVDVQDEGPRAVIGSIEFSGNRKNTPEALLSYLDLKPGQQLTSQLVSNIEERLWRSARFLTNSVSFGSPAASGRVPLRIEVVEFPPAPPIDQEFSRADQAMLKLRQWLSRLGEGQDEANLTCAGFPTPTSRYELILAPQGGLAVLAGDTSPKTLSKGPEGVVITSNLAAFYSPLRAAKLDIPRLSEGLLLAATVSCKASETNDQPFDFTFGAGFTPPEADSGQHFQVKLALPPVACIGLNQRLKTTNWFAGDELIRSSANMLFRIDARTGRIMELRLTNDENHATLELRFERGAFARSVQQLERAGASLPNAYDSNAPLSTSIGFVAQEFLSSDLLKTVLRSNLPPATWDRLPALLRQTKLREVLAPLDQLLAQPASPTNYQEAFVVPESLASQDAANSSSIGLAASWFIEHSDQFVPSESWAQILLREAGLVLQGRSRYTVLALESIYESSDTGPIGCLTAAKLLAGVQPPVARMFAARGLERLSAADFRRDCGLFLEGNTLFAQCFAKLAGALRALEPEDIEALAAIQSPARARFMRDAFGFLRAAKNQPVMTTLAPALDAYWEQELKTQVAGALREISMDVAAVYDQALKLYQAQPPDFPQALELFQQAAERGHSGAQFLLGQIYENGQGVPKDLTNALSWYRQAATSGSPAAAMSLASIYSDGVLVPSDRLEVFVWYSVAAAQGNKVAEALRKGVQQRLTPAQTEEGNKRVGTILAGIPPSTSSANQTPANKE